MKHIKSIAITMMIILAASNALAAKLMAIVGDSAITVSDFEARAKLLSLSTGFNSEDPAVLKVFNRQVLEAMIDEKIIENEAAKKAIEVDDHEVDRAVAYLAKSNGYDLATFAQNLKAAGSSIDELRKQARGQLLWQKLLSIFVEKDVVVSNSEIQEALALQGSKGSKSTSYDLSEIVVADKEFADDLYEQLKQGASFEKLAREFSEDQSAKDSGRMGLVAFSQLPKTVQAKLSGSSSGKFTQPIKVNDVYHIYFINAISSNQNLSDEEMRKNAENYIFEKKMSTAMRAYLRKLRRSTYVEIKK